MVLHVSDLIFEMTRDDTCNAGGECEKRELRRKIATERYAFRLRRCHFVAIKEQRNNIGKNEVQNIYVLLH